MGLELVFVHHIEVVLSKYRQELHYQQFLQDFLYLQQRFFGGRHFDFRDFNIDLGIEVGQLLGCM